jgi:hypothetical protein
VARKGSSKPFLGTHVGRLKIKDWLTKKHYEYWAGTPGMGQLKVFIEVLSEKLSMDLLAWNQEHDY